MKVQSKVIHWAPSTESKITDFLDNYIIKFPQSNVRKSTKKLLTSLYHKGTQQQRLNLQHLIQQRINLLSYMGRSSQQFLDLIQAIFQKYPNQYPQIKHNILYMIFNQCSNIFGQIFNHHHSEFYSFCANMIHFDGQFKPYLLQTNGCLRCFGKPQTNFEIHNINQVKQQCKVHINKIQFILKRKYEIKNLQINFGKKKINFKTLCIYSLNKNGQKHQQGVRYNNTDIIPPLNLTTSIIIFEFEFQKSKKNHISCLLCGNSDEYCYICSNCVSKCLEIQGNFKIIGSNCQKLSQELCQKYNNLNWLKKTLFSFYLANKQNRKVTLIPRRIINDMQEIYTEIIENLPFLKDEELLLENLQQKQMQIENTINNCFSCNFYTLTNMINFLKNLISKQLINFTSQQLSLQLKNFKNYLQINKIQTINKNIIDIVAKLIIIKKDKNYILQFKIKINNYYYNSIIIRIICSFIINLKQKNQLQQQNWKQLLLYLNSKSFIQELNIIQKIQIFVSYFISLDKINLITQNQLNYQKIGQIHRLTQLQLNLFSNLLNFSFNLLLNLEINNYIRLFLKLIPLQYVPVCTWQMCDKQYLQYTQNKLPQIQLSYINLNIVYNPNAILKLNAFEILPAMMLRFSIEDAVKAVSKLCQFKKIWNLNVKQSLENFQKKLGQIDYQRQLLVSLQGYHNSKQLMYLRKIYQILVPQRSKFIIRMQVPEADMAKQQRSRDGGPMQYIYLPIREVKSEDLNGDTMKSLHDWVTLQLKKLNQDMSFDLIVEKSIIDNLDLPIEVVYHKIVQKEVKKQIGNQNYHFLKVIYRIQGIFGEANQRASANPRDEKLQDCMAYSSQLLTRLPQCNEIGLSIIINILKTLKKNDSYQNRYHREMLFKILQMICLNNSILKKIIQYQYGDKIISTTIKFLSLTKLDIKQSQILLQICSKIINQANEQMTNLRKNTLRKQSEYIEIDLIDKNNNQSEILVKYILQKIKECQDNCRKDLAKKLIKLLPYCSKDDYNSSKYLFQYFQLNHLNQLPYSTKIYLLFIFLQSISQSYISFKTVCRENKITEEILTILMEHINYKAEDNKQVSSLEYFQLCLMLLKGLIQGDYTLQQRLFSNKIIHEIYQIANYKKNKIQQQSSLSSLSSSLPSSRKASNICYDIIKYLSTGKIVCPQLKEFIYQKQQDKKNKNTAQKNKKKQLMKKKIAKNLINFEKMIQQDQQNEIILCSSCRQGYNKKKQILGIYLYSSKIQNLLLQSWWKDNKKINCITSVSYFMPIHFQCHNMAFQADQKIQKSQWQGALIRNNGVLCNNWLPFKGSKTTDEQFDKVLRKYFQRSGNKNITNLTNIFWLPLLDLHGLLQKFSKQYNFSQETKGSNHLHNCKLILILVGLICHCMKNSQQIRYLHQGITYLQQNYPKKSSLLNLYFCINLFLYRFDSLNRKKTLFWKMITNMTNNNPIQRKSSMIYLLMILHIAFLLAKNALENKCVPFYVDAYIPQNFVVLLTQFQQLAEKYKNQYVKLESIEQFKKALNI